MEQGQRIWHQQLLRRTEKMTAKISRFIVYVNSSYTYIKLAYIHEAFEVYWGGNLKVKHNLQK